MRNDIAKGQHNSIKRQADMPGLIRLLHELGQSALFVPYTRAR